MADPAHFANPEVLIALKKGTQLVKYSRKGKPKFRAFRLSQDEKSLIWISHGEEKTLKLSSVQRIIPGQRTAVFRRYLRPEKDYLSFSLLYNNGERSLDLICKDKVEAELWLGCLKALIGQNHKRRTKSLLSDEGDLCLEGRLSSATIDSNENLSHGRVSIDLTSRGFLSHPQSSDAGSERINMQMRTSGADGFRVSVSSNPIYGGSSPDDIESLGDLFVWGEVWSDGVTVDGSVSSFSTKVDVLTPKPLESDIVLDVHQIACGEKHFAIVTRQGEVFTWGEESSGRLGHGNDKDLSHPLLVDFLAFINMEFVACGKYHTCAVSSTGDLFTWGDGIHNAGLLGHGTGSSHWIPKRVSGPLEELQVVSVACGAWHTALATSNGKLFTYGDGTFGVLGHGNRESVAYPKEVQSLNGLKAISVACGLWHTAAIVELTGQSGVTISSRKLFTWGDGDKNRLGHGNKDAYLLPTCVSALIDYSFHQLACGHTMTVALTTSGHVFTMGSAANGQLGNPISDGKSPCLVQDRLIGEYVEEIACGDYHVAVLTSRNEVFTWGRGANGRLGHGDTEDRRTPTLVEALKDRHVKNISCGSNFTSSICIHKWVSGTDQSVCSGCHQAFGFTRKRHNCYNCGLVHCHACSSKKAVRAALAPTPGKPHRVCDACYVKLKSPETGNVSNMNRKATVLRSSVDGRTRPERQRRSSRLLLPPTTEPIKYFDTKAGRQGYRSDAPSVVRGSQVPSLSQFKDVAFPGSLTALQNAFKPVNAPSQLQAPTATPLPPINSSRSSSPYTRRPSPPRSRTSGFSRSVIESLRKSNEVLNQEVTKLQKHIKNLEQKCEAKDTDIQKLQKNVNEKASCAAKESSKCSAAKEVVESITDQLKEMTEKLPLEHSKLESLKSVHAQAEAFLRENEASEAPLSSSPTCLHNSEMIGQTREENGDAKQGTRNEGLVARLGSMNESSSAEASGMRSGSEREIISQFEPGVYVTYVLHTSGNKLFKRVRFSKKRFDGQQAEEWWNQNKHRVLKKYSPHKPTTLLAAPSSGRPPADASSEVGQSSET